MHSRRLASAAVTPSLHPLVAVRGQLLLGLVVHLCALLGLRQLLLSLLLALVVRLAVDFPPLLEPVQRSVCAKDRWRDVTYLATTSWYFQPNSWPRRPTVQYLRPGFNRSTLSAWGTTTRFFLSYGGGTPSKVLRRSRAAAPRAVLCGIIPRTVRQNILDGARKWKGPEACQPCSSEYIWDAVSGASYLHGWGCNGSACGGRPGT